MRLGGEPLNHQTQLLRSHLCPLVTQPVLDAAPEPVGRRFRLCLLRRFPRRLLTVKLTATGLTVLDMGFHLEALVQRQLVIEVGRQVSFTLKTVHLSHVSR